MLLIFKPEWSKPPTTPADPNDKWPAGGQEVLLVTTTKAPKICTTQKATVSKPTIQVITF